MKINLLLVDDNEVMFDIVKQYCLKNSKFQANVDWCSSTDEAIEKFKSNYYDMLLVDVSIDHRSGFDFLKEIEPARYKVSRKLSVPAIILSNSSAQADAVNAFKHNVSDFIPKSHLTQNMIVSTIYNVYEKYLLQLNVERNTTELEKINSKLTKQNNEIQTFYQNLSHELKTPLTSLSEFIAVLRDGILGPLTAEQLEVLQVAHKNCEQITLYINDLINLSQLQTGKYSLNYEATDMTALVRQTIASAEVLAGRKQILINHLPQSQIPQISVDPKRCYQVLINLLDNAIKYSEANTQITVNTHFSPDSDIFTLSVSDEGKGIEKEHLDNIFDRLYQGQGATESKGNGLGIGLAIVKEIIDLHQGKIKVESTPNQGSTFSVLLPRLPHTN